MTDVEIIQGATSPVEVRKGHAKVMGYGSRALVLLRQLAAGDHAIGFESALSFLLKSMYEVDRDLSNAVPENETPTARKKRLAVMSQARQRGEEARRFMDTMIKALSAYDKQDIARIEQARLERETAAREALAEEIRKANADKKKRSSRQGSSSDNR